MALIPGTLPSDTCYGTPQDLLELFAQYLDVPAFALNSKVVFSNANPASLTADVVWFDTGFAAPASATNPILKITVSGGFVDYINNYATNLAVVTTPAAGDYLLISQSNVLKKITYSNITPASGSITYPMLNNGATEANNAAKRTAKAWVMFNGTGTPAIANSFNVSSITDGGVGLFTINLTVVASQNDCVVCNASDRDPAVNIVDFNEAYMTTGGNVFFSCFDQSAFKDPLNAHAAVFGN